MADYRLKIKIGEHEFDAEGPVADVQAQFAVWKELVSLAPANASKQAPNTPSPGTPNSPDPNAELPLDKIMKADGRIVSLTVPAASSEDAILLIMLGQRHYRGSDAVTGGEIADGLKHSGQPVDRTDRYLNKLSTNESGLVLANGERRGRRYRLTNLGIAKAKELGRALISLVP